MSSDQSARTGAECPSVLELLLPEAIPRGGFLYGFAPTGAAPSASPDRRELWKTCCFLNKTIYLCIGRGDSV